MEHSLIGSNRVMNFLVLLVLFVAATQIEGTCNYDGNIVKETGYPDRPMTQAEKDQIVFYRKEWNQWAQQLTRYIQGKDTMPVTPVMPCFCHKCDW